ncbi:hypothetical protein BGZ52_006054 [Haplosporangium bisporale]|nr:hypothetical protein BGZ52_006054 [Haplosporangium bisporale]
MRGVTETLSSTSPSLNSDLGAQLLATRTYGIYVGVYLGLVLCCDHYRLHLYQSFTVLILGFALLWSAYPSFPNSKQDEPSSTSSTNGATTIDTQDAITTRDAVWSPKAPVFLISTTSIPNVSWTETVSPGDDPPPPYPSSPTKGNTYVYYYPPSIFRSILSMGGLVVTVGTLVYMTAIDTIHLVGPTSDIAWGIIGIMMVAFCRQIIKDLISTQPSTSPVSLKKYRLEPTVQDKALETKLDIIKSLKELKEETSCCVAFDNNVNDNNDELCSEPSLDPWLETLETLSSFLATSEHGEVELFGEEDKDGQEQVSNETDLEQYQQQEPTEELFLSLLELQEAQETKEFQESEKDQSQMAELVCKHPKDLHRATQQCSFDMRSPERPLPRLVSSVSFDSFLPYLLPVEMPNDKFSRRTAPLPEKRRKELVSVRSRIPLAKRPHVPQHEDDESAISRPFSLERRSQSLVTISRRKSDVDLFTISLFVLPSMIRRPLMLFSRSLQTTFSIQRQHSSGETNLDAEYDNIKQGGNVTETTPKQLQRSLTSVSLSRGRPMHMKHKRGSSESLDPSALRRRSFFSLESDTLQSIFQFYRRRQAKVSRSSSEAVGNDNTPVEPEEEQITFVVRSNMLPTVRVGLYGTAQRRMWTSTGSMVFQAEEEGVQVSFDE